MHQSHTLSLSTKIKSQYRNRFLHLKKQVESEIPKLQTLEEYRKTLDTTEIQYQYPRIRENRAPNIQINTSLLLKRHSQQDPNLSNYRFRRLKNRALSQQYCNASKKLTKLHYSTIF